LKEVIALAEQMKADLKTQKEVEGSNKS